MKKIIRILSFILGCYGTASFAKTDQDYYLNDFFNLNKFSGSLVLTSNYIWRGVTQTENHPAIQGSLTYTFDSGIYVNIWASNVDFGNTSNAYIELDPSVGYAGKLENGLSYDLWIVRYNYPDAQNLSYNEAHLALSYSIFQLNLGFTNNVFRTRTNGTYYSLAINHEIPQQIFHTEGLSINAGIGRFDINKKAGNSYNDYIITLTKKINSQYSVSIAFTDTNRKFSGNSLDGPHVAATLTYSF